MNYHKILEFISENQHNDLKDLYDKCYSKLQDLNKRIDRNTISLLVVIMVYFFLAKTSVESVNIGPFSIKDISIVGQLLPVLFAYLLFDLLISSIHKTEVLVTVKMLFLSAYIQEIEPSDFETLKNKQSFFTRVLLPFSFTTELSRLVSHKTSVGLGCFGIVLALPLISLYVLPFVLEYYMLKDLYLKGFNDPVGKISFFLTLYINFIILFYYVKVVISNYQDMNEHGKF